MRFSTLLLALPVAIVSAQDQVPLKEKAAAWFEKAKSFIPSTPPNPIDAGAAYFAETRVHKFTQSNYDQKLKPTSQNPADGPEEWMILVTGGNKTCFGRCEEVNDAWNKSVALLSVLPSCPRLGLIDCERQGLLCSTWAAAIPSIYYFQIPVPAPGQSPPRTPLYIIPLNTTTTTPTTLTSIVSNRDFAATTIDPKDGASKEKYRYDGYFHPINGELKVFGLLDPLGYLMWGFGQVPSFVLMIAISFISRNLMGRRAGRTAPGGPGAAPAPAPAAAR